ncbi:helix-turn-helix domain-containing protein [Streptomyces sp. NPDC053079]|uniref:helix-turn-helix domain-containing protein n=1 Tax=Streptomyces sp. NPDC053079 TaxID=3365697 RepID=UPI0037D85069
MTGETSQPPMAWRLCGNQVKLWRMDAGVSREALSQEAGYGYETVKSMEQGRRRPSQRLLEVADEMCGAKGKLLAALNYLQPDRAPWVLHLLMDAEATAVAQCHYQTVLIPGLLQTEEYARAFISTQWPPVDDETIEQRVGTRLERQERLKRPTVMFSFVLYEAALRTRVGGPDTMRRQLLHLLEVGAQRNVSVQVLRADQGSFGWLNGPMVLLETEGRDLCAYVEGQGFNSLFVEREKVSALSQRYGMLRTQALNTEDSAEFIRKLAEE